MGLLLITQDTRSRYHNSRLEGMPGRPLQVPNQHAVLHGIWSSVAMASPVYRGQTTGLELMDRVGSADPCAARSLRGYLTGDVAKAARKATP